MKSFYRDELSTYQEQAIIKSIKDKVRIKIEGKKELEAKFFTPC